MALVINLVGSRVQVRSMDGKSVGLDLPAQKALVTVCVEERDLRLLAVDPTAPPDSRARIVANIPDVLRVHTEIALPDYDSQIILPPSLYAAALRCRRLEWGSYPPIDDPATTYSLLTLGGEADAGGVTPYLIGEV